MSSTRAALYHRVSTNEQDPTTARAELRRAAEARSMTVALEIEETGSGARNDRPGLQRLMDAARRGRIDAVLCWKLDRFGRSALDLLANIRALEDAGVRFLAVTQSIDIKANGDPMSKLIVTVLAAIAEFERDLITSRTKLGLARARAAGRQLGRPRVVVDVARAIELRTAGLSYAAISNQLGVSVGKLHAALKSVGGRS